MIESRKKKPKPEDRIEEDPGAEERFERAVKRALSTPPQPFTPGAKKPKQHKDMVAERKGKRPPGRGKE